MHHRIPAPGQSTQSQVTKPFPKPNQDTKFTKTFPQALPVDFHLILRQFKYLEGGVLNMRFASLHKLGFDRDDG